MSLDRSVLLQKQVKNNSEDLQNEFLDLKNWEAEMKQKDQLLRKESSSQSTLPPIRSKNKKGKKVERQTESITNPKKIRSCDYSAWDKFDVEKACEEIDKDETASYASTIPEEKVEDTEHAWNAATKFKNEGNTFVQQKQWDKAVASYNEAIKLFPYDAVFYANRALCHLKLNNLYFAESDCTAALQLDDRYVKAYHRRATVRVVMQRYKDAKQDLQEILKLEPSNKESKALLAEVEKKIEKSKPTPTLEKTEVNNKSIEKAIAEKMFSSSKTSVKSKDVKNQELKIQEMNSAEFSSAKQNKKYLSIPDWMPEKDNVAIVEPIEKAPHLRSKKPLTKIPVKEVKYIKLPDNVLTSNEQTNISTEIRENNTSTVIEKSRSPESAEETADEILQVPKTATQFLINWRKNVCPNFRYKYLMQLYHLSSYSLFEDLIEPNILSEIIGILATEFIKRKEDVYTHLHKLSLIKRFRALVMLMTNTDKINLELLFDYITHNYKDAYGDKIADLRKMYEI